MLENDFSGDAGLVGDVLCGSAQEFDRLVERHFGKVFAVAYANLGDREMAEDLSQEVFLRAYLHLAALKHPELFLAWIVRITRNLAFSWRSKAQTASRLLPLLSIEEMPMEPRDERSRSPRDLAAEREQERLLSEAIMKLDPALREMMLLHYAEGLSQAEIARALGVERSTISRQFSRALAELRRHIESPPAGAGKSLGASRAAAARASAAVLLAAGLSAPAKAALLAASADTAALAATSATGAAVTGFAANGAIGSLLGLKGALVAVAIAVFGTTGYYYTTSHKMPARTTGHAAELTAPGAPRISAITESRQDSSLPRGEHAGLGNAAGAQTTQPGNAQSGTGAGGGAQSTVRLVGRVTSEMGGPVSGAAVTFSSTVIGKVRKSGPTAKTDAEGRYTIAAPPQIEVHVKARAAGFAPASSPSITAGSDGTMVPDIVLMRGGTISGRVFDETSAPVAGAPVLAYVPTDTASAGFGELVEQNGPGGPPALTDKQGAFELLNVPGGLATLEAQKDGYFGEPVRLNLAKGETTSGVEILLEKKTEISGVVLDAVTSKPIEGASVAASSGKVTANSGSGKSDAQGRFRMQLALRPSLTFSASHPDYATFQGNVPIVRDTPVQIVMNREKEYVLIGDVLHAQTRQPVENFTVEFTTTSKGLAAPVVEYAPGRFTARLRGDIGSEVIVRAPGYGGTSMYLMFLLREVSEVRETFLMYPAIKVAGRLVQAGGKVPAAGLEVIIQASSSRNTPSAPVISGTDGKFVCEVAASRGNYASIQVRKPGDKTQVHSCEMTIPDVPEPDLGDIEIGGPIRVYGTVVRLPDEVPVANEKLTLSAMKKEWSTLTDANGAYEFKDVPNDNLTRFMLAVSLPNRKVSSSVSSNGDSDPNGDIRLPIRIGGVRLNGTVTQGGAPVRCAVSSRAEGGLGATGESRADGTFTMENLSPGRTRITLRPPGESFQSFTEEIEVPDLPEFERSFKLPTARVFGRVLGPDGEPLSGVNIWTSRRTGEYRESTKTAISDADGRYELRAIFPGKLYAVAFKSSTTEHDLAVGECVVPEEGEVQLDLRFQSDAATLVSEVYALEDGEPRPYAGFTILTMDGAQVENSNVRDANGRIVARIPPGTYDVTVSDGGFTSAHHRVTLAAGETKVLRDVLQHSGSVSIRVQRKGGGTVTGAAVQLLPLDPQSIQLPLQGTTNAAGKWECDSVLPGRYRAEAGIPPAAPVTQEIHVPPGGTTPVTLTVP